MKSKGVRNKTNNKPVGAVYVADLYSGEYVILLPCIDQTTPFSR